MFLTLSQAARAVKKSKNTLIRAIEKGRLSATRGENNVYQIDPRELAKVYGVSVEAEQMDRPGPPDTRYKTELAVLRAVLEEVQAGRDEARQARDDARRERDGWKAQADAWRAQAERLAVIAESKTQG
jgi:hypothetical protein